MTSVLLVDTIKNSLDSADTVAFAGGIHAPGSVIQVVHKIYNGGAGTTSSSYAAFGRSITITPKFASSKIIVTWSAVSYQNGGNGYLTVYRTLSGGSATNMYNNGDYDTNSTQQSLRQVGNSSSGLYFPGHLTFTDTTHNSTSQITYDVYGKVAGGSSIYFPPGSTDASDVVAMEIAQ